MFGLSAEFVSQITQDDEFVVWYDSWPSVELFASCATQWRLLPMGGVQGLDYGSVRAVLVMRGVLDQEAMFDDVRALELGALTAFRGQSLDIDNG